jgi:hypothetical protein
LLRRTKTKLWRRLFGCAEGSVDGAEKLVEPVQGLLNELVARDVVTRVIEQMFLLILFWTEQPEKWILGWFHREEEIVLPIQHQLGLFDTRHEVDDIHFREWALEIEAPKNDDAEFDAGSTAGMMPPISAPQL